MSQPTTTRHDLDYGSPPSSSMNNFPSQQQQQPPSPPLINLDSDEDDNDDVMLLDTVPRTVQPLASLPVPPPPSSTPLVVCLVKTGGKYDYQEDCFCVKCHKIKAYLEFWDAEAEGCLCKECRQDCTGAGGGHRRRQQQQQFFSDDDDDDAEDYDEMKEKGQEEENEKMNTQSEDSSDKQNQMHLTSAAAAAINNKKKMVKMNAKASTNSRQCPRCQVIKHSTKQMVTHYRVVHLGYKPYFCMWTKCSFKSGYSHCVRRHIISEHSNATGTVQNVKLYVGERDGHQDQLPPTDTLLSDHLLATTGHHWPVTCMPGTGGPATFDCHKCGRKFGHSNSIQGHLESHDHTGFRCAWPNCGHFYSRNMLAAAKRHVCVDHLGSSAYSDLTDSDKQDANGYLKRVASGNDSY